MGTDGVKVLDKALFILSQFFQREELSLKDLVEISGMNRATIYRILQVFIKWGFLQQDETTKRYKLTLKIVEITGLILRKMSLLNICRPYLLELRDETGESPFLSRLREGNIIIVDWEPSYYDALINVTVGKAVPAYCSGAGKAILAFLPPNELDSLMLNYKLKSYTEKTITDKNTLRRVLVETAKRGYGVSMGEYDTDIIVVGAPIFDIHNRVIASCAIGALKYRVKHESQIKKYGKMVVDAALEISRKLGSSR